MGKERESAIVIRFPLVVVFIFLILIVSVYFFIRYQKNFEKVIKEKFYIHTRTYIVQTIDTIKRCLLAQALMISKDACVEKSYREGNPELLKGEFKAFWKRLHKEFNIEEMHFFKYPQINWFAFTTMNKEPFKATVRKDILWIEAAFRPDCYFYVCKRFPGLRASYPIVVDGEVVGALSFGIHIETVRNILQKSIDTKIFYLLNKKILKINLSSQAYKKLQTQAFLEDKNYLYFHINRTFSEVILKKGKLEDKNYAFLFYPIYDVHGQLIGYIGASRNFNEIFEHIKFSSLFVVGTLSFIFFVIFVLTISQISYLNKQGKEVLYLLELLKDKKFSDIEEYFKDLKSMGDVYDVIKKNIYRISAILKDYIEFLHERIEETSEKAFKDALTMANNRYVIELLEEEIAKVGRDIRFSVVMIDIDYFKQINDTYGHDVGDLVLKRLTEDIRSIIRSKDILIRYGGEEFIIYLPDTSKKEALKLAERIRKHIESRKIKVDHKEFSITVSIGVAERKNEETLNEVIKKADEALYRAKLSGRNKVMD
ncbi:diguanylate cyclase [Desulfurobacterium thermolithotrophum]|uniref:sensor domain-containing diguanylate cyclase n=1 Tax=Desulfurobacterium thermolithotrophum TaxID=64160 RepID=UPI0013D0FB0C|nr:diguanylate cyclase [Desulfurobacterium thermolithotrophum]